MKEQDSTPEIELRLHRVKITLNKKDIKCPYALYCVEAENCYRCNIFYSKCVIYIRESLNKVRVEA